MGAERFLRYGPERIGEGLRRGYRREFGVELTLPTGADKLHTLDCSTSPYRLVA